MTEELTLTVTDLERKAIEFCREKNVFFPIVNYLIEFAEEVTKELQKEIETLKHNKKTVTHLSSCISDVQEKKIAELEQKLEQTEKEKTELKEFFENEYFQIADRTADEKIKELEKHQVEVTVDDYSPYDSNTWGDMHEEWFVPKEEVRDLLKENYALITKAKEIIKNLLRTLYYWKIEVDFNEIDNSRIEQAEQFLEE